MFIAMRSLFKGKITHRAVFNTDTHQHPCCFKTQYQLLSF